MNRKLALWLKGLLSAGIGGAANAVTAMIVDPSAFNLAEGAGKLATMAAVSALVSVAMYLKASPIPDYCVDEAGNVVPKKDPGAGIKTVVGIVIFCAVNAAILSGCATTGPALDTPEKRYTAARGELNIMLGEYLAVQEDVAPDDHARIKAAFFSADEILDAWEATVLRGDDAAANYAAWLRAKSKILEAIGGLQNE
jgi:hypothetical protein